MTATFSQSCYQSFPQSWPRGRGRGSGEKSQAQKSGSPLASTIHGQAYFSENFQNLLLLHGHAEFSKNMRLSRTEDRGAGSRERGEGCLATCRLVANNDYNEVNDDDQYSGGGGGEEF